MGLIFGNPAGLWALLGIPAILLIHFLQKERREVVASTLFLLHNLQRQSKAGIRFKRLRNSLPLWLQILSVLLLTWMLTEPRWLRPDSVHRVAIVLDSSASMSAFREEAVDAVERRAGELSRTSARQEWVAIESDRRRGTLYAGDSRIELRDALAAWRPRSGTHDPLSALSDARALLRGAGSVIFVTDRARDDLPDDVDVIATGTPIENCGFTGLAFQEREDGLVWQVLVHNYGRSVQTRHWQATFEGRPAEPQAIQLAPGQTVSISGPFPPGASDGFLTLEDDAFPLDDQIPLVRPQPKPLALFTEEHPLLADFAPRFLESFPDWQPAAAGIQEDVRLATRTTEQAHPARPGIYFLIEPQPPENFLTAPIVAENHPLVRDLNWQGLLVQSGTEVELREQDRVLIWQGDRPLIVLRETPAPNGMGIESRLFCHFDLRYSNAGRLPSFILLLHRFLEDVRSAKPVFEQRNLQTSQIYSIAANPLGDDLSIRFTSRSGTVTEQSLATHRTALLQAPGEPGLLEITQGDQLLLRAGVYFADSREADFTNASAGETGSKAEAALIEENTVADFLTPIWLLSLTGLLLSTWWLTGQRRN